MLACAFAYRDADSYGTGHYEYILISTENTEQLRRGKTFYNLASMNIFYGIAIYEDTMSMLVAHYND
ncbi:MAG: hypothetical protein J6040_02965, partial [Clostridiales bacterium]|nr:hypothetical protein [Clostridiales bacterium]